jgi:hypothetical protein
MVILDILKILADEKDAIGASRSQPHQKYHDFDYYASSSLA